MFTQLPIELNGYELQEHHAHVKFDNPEVLLELIEYEVILPIVSYRKGLTVYALEFHKTLFQIRKIIHRTKDEFEVDVLKEFPATKLKEAIDFLQEKVQEKSLQFA